MQPVSVLKSNGLFSLSEFKVAAGFPNPAEDCLSQPISLDNLLMARPNSSFLFKVAGDSMLPDIQDGAIIVVDKSLKATSGRIVLATLDNEFVVKRLKLEPENNRALFLSSNSEYEPIVVDFDGENNWDENFIWGVVTSAISIF
ncbi:MULTISPECIES: LexA family transcriptional regulator [unclassified Pseudoalteromonas]|uniref:LexA family protein n=1 Tax=unclassified Pseudoalteromonas TaxID=194690 RepID=UPI002358F1B4|nr:MULTISPECIES: S24 family peptidase [unclassified Pseudoalteromonas]MDC9563382.1 S24 family peptidase [Pseudoalteromonas sp. GAB2316C]MDC9572136.1 S24 family peptidase [Pseudoalteromonas sp. GABNS16A]MDC9583829.1 S24 family peptidase [Pseudoalteromonas sp. GABNS16C]MDC9607775.1 S24 family peptidase [Pseudoalteromonas sp. GABNS16H]